MRVRIACSPDSDDAFMFHALLTGKVDARGMTFEAEAHDTEMLNAMAEKGEVDVLAVSVARYPSIADRYQLLPHGASVGRGYGPVVVTPSATDLESLRDKRIAVPGLRTTAHLVLRLLLDRFEPVVVPIVPYERVWEALRRREVDAALVIHEGRLAFEDEGFVLVCDIGAEWMRLHGLPLPLGINVIRRALGRDVISRISALCRESIAWALRHPEAVRDAIRAGSPLKSTQLDQYLTMYANADTARMAPDVIEGMSVLFREARNHGLIDTLPPLDLSP